MVFQAVHPISKGEEITHYYTFLLNSSRERREDLLAKFGFECACDVCALPAKEVEASDKRRAAVKAALEAIPGLLSSPLRIVLKVRQALRDLEREGLETGKAALAYDVFQVRSAGGGVASRRAETEFFFQAALMYSDEASARKWAEFVIECHVVADGPDSTKCVEARKEAAGLRKDPRFGKYGRKMVGGPD